MDDAVGEPKGVTPIVGGYVICCRTMLTRKRPGGPVAGQKPPVANNRSYTRAKDFFVAAMGAAPSKGGGRGSG